MGISASAPKTRMKVDRSWLCRNWQSPKKTFFWIASPVSSHLISNMIVTVDRQKVEELCELIEMDDITNENKKEQEKELK